MTRRLDRIVPPHRSITQRRGIPKSAVAAMAVSSGFLSASV
jgi:hypothetical protein